jgi:hypothetical protein
VLYVELIGSGRIAHAMVSRLLDRWRADARRLTSIALRAPASHILSYAHKVGDKVIRSVTAALIATPRVRAQARQRDPLVLSCRGQSPARSPSIAIRFCCKRSAPHGWPPRLIAIRQPEVRRLSACPREMRTHQVTRWMRESRASIEKKLGNTSSGGVVATAGGSSYHAAKASKSSMRSLQ